MTFKPKATYDRETDTLYVRLVGPSAMVERQDILDDLRIVDYSGAGAVVGIEFLCATEGIDLSDVPFDSLVEDAINQGGQSFPILV